MSLSELIRRVEAHEKTLTVFNPDEGLVATLRDHFADRNLTVVGEETETGPSNYAVLGEGEQFLTAVDVRELLDEDRELRPDFDSVSYRPIVDALDETMFTSLSKRRMLAASREIEDRAWRFGKGELHAGFQRLSILAGELDVYERLGGRDGLSVHAYGVPDAPVPDADSFTIHAQDTEEIAKSWFVVYDGGGVEENKCALVAEERDDGRFYGFWTYGPDTVDYVVDHLTSTYAKTEADGGTTPDDTDEDDGSVSDEPPVGRF
jgi:DICT domain-containing protein